MANSKDDVQLEAPVAAPIDAAPTAPVEAPATVDAARQARWQAFLELASTQNATFALQKERGEFDKVPDSFF